MAAVRRSLPLILSLVLLFGLGGVGVSLVGESRQAAEAAYRQSTLEKQRVVASLTEQYLLLAANDLNEWSERAVLQLTPGAAADTAALEGLVAESRYFNHGAVLSSLQGIPLNAYTHSPGLPPATDPGYNPLRASLRQGMPGVSSVMTLEDVHVVAVAVPVRDEAGQPRAMLVGYFNAATSPLQSYSEKLKERSLADGYVVDSVGRIVSSRQDAAEVGRDMTPSAALEAVAKGESGTSHVTRGGVEIVVGYAPVGLGGWSLVEELDADTYYGSLRSKSDSTRAVVVVLLLVGSLTALLLHLRVERTRRRAQRRWEALIRDSGDVTSVFDGNIRVLYTSPAVERVLGFTVEECIGRSGFEWVHPDDTERIRAMIDDLLASRGGQRRTEARVLRADGSYVPCDVTLTNALQDPDVRGLVLNMRDMSELTALHEELTHRALHDPLTDLPNRTLLEQRIDERLDQRKPARADISAALFVDVDGFKQVNDLHGHSAGDGMLVGIASRLLSCIREGDTVSRLGGDEFVIFLDGVADEAEAAAAAARVLNALREPFLIEGHELFVGASIGVALGQPGQTADALLREADAAMYRAKDRGKSRFEVGAA